MRDPSEAWSTPEPVGIAKVAALTNPVRRRIIDLLSLDGPATVGALASATGERVGSISHHLKMLARAELVTEAPECARDRRESWWKAVPGGLSWSIVDFEDEPSGEVVADAAEHAQLRVCADRVQAWLSARPAYGRDWQQAAYSSTGWLRLTPAQLCELGDAITKTVREFAERVAAADTPADTGSDSRSVFVFTYATPAEP
ncbi:MAG TPA: winged helix-turn-helix domain-containing protein [Gaiellales bacterium]|jgi:DNA-binding transcriptional ArsR family regulator